MRHLFSIILFVIFCSCKEKKSTQDNNLTTRYKPINYDSSKFNGRIIPDTTGCMWLIEDRLVIDTLFFEKAVIRVFDSETFLTTSTKHKVLRPCGIPTSIAIPNDTILISGFVYIIYDFEYTRGYPTLVKQIEYIKGRAKVLNNFKVRK